jgi:hypothetical protein
MVVTPVSPSNRQKQYGPAGALWQCEDVATGTDPQDAEAQEHATVHPVPDPVHVFPFDFRDPLSIASRLFGAWPFSSGVAVSASALWIRYGPWVMHTPLDNVRSAHVTGPYHWWKVAGPARLSLADNGVTFATSARRGVCLEFKEPVRGGLPTDSVLHPAVTMTVRDPEGLVSLLDTLLRPG